MIVRSTSAGRRRARSRAAATATAPSSGAPTEARPPPNLPSGVRTAPATTISWGEDTLGTSTGTPARGGTRKISQRRRKAQPTRRGPRRGPERLLVVGVEDAAVEGQRRLHHRRHAEALLDRPPGALPEGARHVAIGQQDPDGLLERDVVVV